MFKLRLAVLYLVLVAVTAQDQCHKQQCECEFTEENAGEESPKTKAAKKSEVLAAAAGAMSPLLIGGAGLGIYKLVKNRASSPSLDRSVSSLSETSEGPPPKYKRVESTQNLNPPKAKPTGGNSLAF